LGNLQVGAREREAAKRGESESAADEQAVIDAIGQDGKKTAILSHED
jgi:hypothetical protein